MAGLTTSYRWGGVTRAELKVRLRHNARDAEKVLDTEAAHSNPLIQAVLTCRNRTEVVLDGDLVRVSGSKPVQQIMDFVDDRVALASHWRNNKNGSRSPVAIRKDAAVVVETVLQLDPKFTGPSWSLFEDTFEEGAETYLDAELKVAEDDPELQTEAEAQARDTVDRWRDTITGRREEADRLLGVMVDEVVSIYGMDNIATVSYHFDETSPHVQVMAVPLGEEITHSDGTTERQLKAKNFTGASKSAYAARHDEMRLALQGAGYDATMERVDNKRPNLTKEQLTVHNAEKARRSKKEARLLEIEQEQATERKSLNDDLAALPEMKRKAKTEGRSEGYKGGKAEGLEVAEGEVAKIRAQAVVVAQQAIQRASEAAQQVIRDAEAEAEQKRQQAELDASTTRTEAGRVKVEAETERQAAGLIKAEAKDTLTEAQRVLRSAQGVVPLAVDEIEYRRQMNIVDSDFLDQLCERNPKIAESRENYRTQRRKRVQFGTPQQQAALDRTVGQTQELARRRFGTGPGGPQASQQRGNDRGDYRSGPSGP